MNQKHLLIADDDTEICEIFLGVGESCDYTTSVVNNSDDFIKQIYQSQPTIIFLDLKMPSLDGIELLRYLADHKCSSGIVLISGMDEKVLSSVMQLGRSHGLNMLQAFSKPVKISLLIDILKNNNVTLNDNMETTGDIIDQDYLFNALENNRLIVHYQPKFSFKTGELIGLESLVRLQPHYGDKLISPDLFIPIAENCENKELIKMITYDVINESFRQHRIWKQKNNMELEVAINLSGNLFDDLTLPDEVEKLATIYDINPKKVAFEVTETELMSNPKVSIDIVTRLRLKGFSVSMDDFGTGYSSLLEFHQYPFNEIKIDKAFVAGIVESKEEQIITKSIIDLAHSLDMTTVAEGIETRETWDILSKLGCDIAQGYYMTPPCSAEQLELWIAANTDKEHRYIHQ